MPTEAALSNRKHGSWNASSVFPPLIKWYYNGGGNTVPQLKSLFELRGLTWVTELLLNTAHLFSPAGLVFTTTAFDTFSLLGISAVSIHTEAWRNRKRGRGVKRKTDGFNNPCIITVTTKNLMEKEKRRGKLTKLEPFSSFNKVDISSGSNVTVNCACICVVVKTHVYFGAIFKPNVPFLNILLLIQDLHERKSISTSCCFHQENQICNIFTPLSGVLLSSMSKCVSLCACVCVCVCVHTCVRASYYLVHTFRSIWSFFRNVFHHMWEI